MSIDRTTERVATSAEQIPIDDRVTLTSVETAYRRMAPIYDWVFNGVFQQGRREALRAIAAAPGERILEVGVGTGLTLRHWPAHAAVTGIDLSPEMLARAEKVRQRRRLENVRLRLMNAQAMDFPDSTFAAVAAMYVVSVAPNLDALMAEMRRVCVPGGRICIVNHFRQDRGALAWIERQMAPYAKALGWDAALPIERITERVGLRIRSIRRVNLGGYWRLIEAENVK